MKIGINSLSLTVEDVIKPALKDIKNTQQRMSFVSSKEYENDINGEDGIKNRIKKIEEYNEENKAGVSLATKLSAAWIQALVMILVGGGVILLAVQTAAQIGGQK